jgi:hypothetical protein
MLGLRMTRGVLLHQRLRRNFPALCSICPSYAAVLHIGGEVQQQTARASLGPVRYVHGRI